MFSTIDDFFSSSSVEGDLFFPFYSNYLSYEDHETKSEDAHERLTQFYFAIQELVGAGKHALAFGVYQDLVSKRNQFFSQQDPCKEEVSDMMEDIIQLLRSAGMFASQSDLIIEENKKI